jgi:imidazolonepropionase-like amidohydrolase
MLDLDKITIGFIPKIMNRFFQKKRRECILIADTLLLLFNVFILTSCNSRSYDFVIANVKYLRGEGLSENGYFIGIQGDKITYIGKQEVPGKSVISGNGLILAPGFIDVNSCNWLSSSAAVLKLKDGITTCFIAHGDTFDANAKMNQASEILNYATSVGLIPVQISGLSEERMFTALEESLRYGAYTIALSPEYNQKTSPAVILN